MADMGSVREGTTLFEAIEQLYASIHELREMMSGNDTPTKGDSVAPMVPTPSVLEGTIRRATMQINDMRGTVANMRDTYAQLINSVGNRDMHR